MMKKLLLLFIVMIILTMVACSPKTEENILEAEVISIVDGVGDQEDYALVSYQPGLLQEAKLYEATNPDGFNVEVGDIVYIRITTIVPKFSTSEIESIIIISIKEE